MSSRIQCLHHDICIFVSPFISYGHFNENIIFVQLYLTYHSDNDIIRSFLNSTAMFNVSTKISFKDIYKCYMKLYNFFSFKYSLIWVRIQTLKKQLF
jgi:hypothetical protein